MLYTLSQIECYSSVRDVAHIPKEESTGMEKSQKLISCLKIPETRRTSFRLFDSSFKFSVFVDTHTCQKLIASSLHVETIARCVM